MRRNKGGGREERREGGRKRGKERGSVVYRYVSWRESNPTQVNHEKQAASGGTSTHNILYTRRCDLQTE